MRIPACAISIVSIMIGSIALYPASAAPQAMTGTISVVVRDGATDQDGASLGLDAAAANALGEKGFTILNDPGHAAYVAEVIVTRTDVGAASVRMRAGNAAVLGTGVSVPIGGGGSRIMAIRRTQLTITIRKRGAEPILWHGAAVTVRSEGSPGGSDAIVASALSEAALRRYPYVSDAVTSVP